MSSSSAVERTVRPRDEKNVKWLLDKEDVGVFLGRIAFVAQEVEFG